MGWPGHRFALGLFLGIICLWLGVMLVVMRNAALPSSAEGVMLVVFEPGTPPDEAFAAITRAKAQPIRQTSFGFIWVVQGQALALQQQGALGAYRNLPISPMIAGCVAVADAKLSEAFSP